MKFKNPTHSTYLSPHRRTEVSSKWMGILILPLFLVFVFYIAILGFDTYESNVEPMEVDSSFETGVDSIKVWVKIQGDYVVSNIGGHIVRWSFNQKEVDTKDLVRFLKEQIEKRQLLAFLRKKDSDNLSVTIIADESLRYMHVIPLIQAMANVGISDYRFQGEKKVF